MLYDLVKDWKGSIQIGDKLFANVGDARTMLSDKVTTLTLFGENSKPVQTSDNKVEVVKSVDVYRVSVKPYMTRPATPEFDFMKRWNNDVPMPLMTMCGYIEKEIRGMYYMNLWGDITASVTDVCMRCGRPITNEVSRYFGMGPVCGQHNYVNPFETEEELKVAVESYRRDYLQKLTWKGWVIKSAITSMEKLERTI